MARLFLAVWPPAPVIEALRAALAPLSAPAPPAALPPGVRWTRPDTWHITVRFLGECEPGSVRRRLDAATLPGSRVQLGPGLSSFGRSVLHVPVAGLDAMAAAVLAATADLGRPPDHDRFQGHLTVARVRGTTRLDAAARTALAAVRVAGAFEARELALVQSDVGGASTYRTVGRWDVPCAAGPASTHT